MTKFLILLNYFERQNMVQGFLRSLKKVDELYPHWTLAFIDDGSSRPGRPVVERYFSEKVVYYNSRMTPDMKNICGGSYMGYYMNQAIDESDADVVVLSGDDDEMVPDYLVNLDIFFQTHPRVLSCYSNAYVFDPFKERVGRTKRLYSDDPNWKGHAWFGKPIRCANKVDGIQVAFRRKCSTTYGAYFPYPVSLNHDAIFFEELNSRCGESIYTGFVGMYKGRHDAQLLKRSDPYSSKQRDPKRRLIL